MNLHQKASVGQTSRGYAQTADRQQKAYDARLKSKAAPGKMDRLQRSFGDQSALVVRFPLLTSQANGGGRLDGELTELSAAIWRKRGESGR